MPAGRFALGIRQCGTPHLLNTNMVVRSGMAIPCGNNITQRLARTRLRKKHGTELRPAGQTPDSPVPFVAIDNLLKLMARNLS